MGAVPDIEVMLAQSDAAWTRACRCNARVQATIERLHDALGALQPPPLAALRTLRELEDRLTDEGYAIEDTLSALRQAAAVARRLQAPLACAAALPSTSP